MRQSTILQANGLPQAVKKFLILARLVRSGRGTMQQKAQLNTASAQPDTSISMVSKLKLRQQMRQHLVKSKVGLILVKCSAGGREDGIGTVAMACGRLPHSPLRHLRPSWLSVSGCLITASIVVV